MAIPDRDTARQLLDGLPDWLVTHSEGVARVAAEAARALADNRVAVDVALVEAAGRLHDIDKLETRTDGQRHGVAAAAWLAELGYAELAGPVASHPAACLLDPERYPRGWESICVSVADRRVGGSFVTIATRLADMARRYPEHAASIKATRDPAEALEARLAEAAGLSGDGLEARLFEAWADGDRGAATADQDQMSGSK